MIENATIIQVTINIQHLGHGQPFDGCWLLLLCARDYPQIGVLWTEQIFLFIFLFAPNSSLWTDGKTCCLVNAIKMKCKYENTSKQVQRLKKAIASHSDIEHIVDHLPAAIQGPHTRRRWERNGNIPEWWYLVTVRLHLPNQWALGAALQSWHWTLPQLLCGRQLWMYLRTNKPSPRNYWLANRQIMGSLLLYTMEDNKISSFWSLQNG